jgi:hypothetical protein
MASAIINSKTVVKKASAFYTVDEAIDPTLYAAIVAGTETLPENSTVRLISNADVATIKFSPDGGTWATAQNVGDSAASRTAVAALATVATADASDLSTAIALSNALKVRLNQVIAALKA